MSTLLLLAMLADAVGEPTGEWRGRSTCQVRPSACKDEEAAFRIERAGRRLRLHLGKIVAGQVQMFGTLNARWDAARRTVVAVSHDRAGRPATWRLHIAGDRASGDVRLADGTISRRIELSRVQ